MALLFLRREKLASSSPSSFLQYGDKRFQVTSNPENGIFLPSPFTEHLSHKLSLKQNSSVDERPFFSRAAVGAAAPCLAALVALSSAKLSSFSVNKYLFSSTIRALGGWRVACKGIPGYEPTRHGQPRGSDQKPPFLMRLLFLSAPHVLMAYNRGKNLRESNGTRESSS